MGMEAPPAARLLGASQDAYKSHLGVNQIYKTIAGCAELTMSTEKPKAKRRARNGQRQDPFLRAAETDSSLQAPSSRRGSLSSGPPSSKRGGLVPSPPSSRRGARLSVETANAAAPAPPSSKTGAKISASAAPSSASAPPEVSGAQREKEPSRLVFALFLAGLATVVTVMLVMGIQARRLRPGRDGVPADKRPDTESSAPIDSAQPSALPTASNEKPGNEGPHFDADAPESALAAPSLSAAQPPASASARGQKSASSGTKANAKNAATKASASGEPASKERPPFQFDDENK